MRDSLCGANVAQAVVAMAQRMPDAAAMQVPRRGGRADQVVYDALSYRELEADSRRIALGLSALGLVAGDRVAVMVPPGPSLFALVFGLLRGGFVTVLADPGMGPRALGVCLSEAAPAAFVGVPEAQAARVLFGWARASLHCSITVGRRWFWGGRTLDEVRILGAASSTRGDLAARGDDDPAAVLFTSGSTGTPKGALYTHGNFAAQVEMLRRTFHFQPGEIDLPTFPLFALFDPALGMTTVLPRMDFTHPAKVDPAEIVAPIRRFHVTTMFGSPALLDRVSRAEMPRKTKLSGLRRVISAGAPVRASILERFAALLDEGAIIATPYGATEALPVAVIDYLAVLGETRAMSEAGAGVCVGKPVDGVRVEIIRIDDEAIARWSDDLRVPDGAIGEIVVASPSVTGSYLHRDAATRLAKIAGPAGEVMHRMGDVGFLDGAGRLWFCGRKSQRVRTASGPLFTEQIEAVFDAHPDVLRTALVGVPIGGGLERPVLCVELERERAGDERSILADLSALAERSDRTRAVATILIHRGAFPVDVRHNAKIFRERLRSWAEGRLA